MLRKWMHTYGMFQYSVTRYYTVDLIFNDAIKHGV